MQQTQSTTPTTPQKRKRKRVSHSTQIVILGIVLAAIAVFWILTILSIIPTLWGVTSDKLGAIASVIITAMGVFFAYVPIVSTDEEPEQHASVAPQPPVITIINNMPNNTPPPIQQPPTIPDIYRGIASQPPSTNQRTIQQRESVVKDVYARLTQLTASSLVLVGIGGLGKSTLAALVYNYVEQQRLAGKSIFKRETLWLRVDEKTTFLDVADNLFSALGNKPPDFEQRSPQSQAFAIVHLLSTLDPPLLIVLDQFENLLNLDTGEALTPETGELLDALNSRSCPSRILLTSRPRPKGIRLAPADNLVVYPVDGLTLVEGEAMLRSQGVQGTEEDLQTAVKRCKGHSLSLYLLALLLDENKMTLAQLLKDPHLWDDDIATNLLDVIYTKYLKDEQRELLQALSIYREPVPQEAVLPLLSDTAKTHIVPLLKTLQAQQLVQVVEVGHRQLHPIVATYAQHHDKQFNKAGMQKAHAQAAQYYLQQAAQIYPPRDERHSVRDVQPLIEAVWQLCQAEQWQEAYKVMDEEELFYSVRLWGSNVILLEIGQNLLVGSDLLEPLQLANVYHQLGWTCNKLGQNENALNYYQQSLVIWQQQGNRKGESATLNNIGGVYRKLGQQQEALQYCNQSLKIKREVGDRDGEGITLNNLGELYRELGQTQDALGYFEQALTIEREVGNREGEGVTFNNLGLVYNALGQPQNALKYYEQALSIRREVGDREGEGITLYNIGTIYYDEKRYNIALSFFILAQGIFVEIQSPNSKSVQGWIDDIHQAIGNEQFAALRQSVEPQAQQIVDKALRELQM